MRPPPPSSTLFPYTTLFRSARRGRLRPVRGEFGHLDGDAPVDVGDFRKEGREGQPQSENLPRSEEHTSELQSLRHLVCRLLLEKKKKKRRIRLRLPRDTKNN